MVLCDRCIFFILIDRRHPEVKAVVVMLIIWMFIRAQSEAHHCLGNVKPRQEGSGKNIPLVHFLTSPTIPHSLYVPDSQVTLGVSQSRVRLLGSTCLPSILLQKRVKNTSWHSENEEWNRLASVRHMRGPALHLPPQIWGNWSVRKALWGF